MLMTIEQNSVIRCSQESAKIGSGCQPCSRSTRGNEHSSAPGTPRIEKFSVMFSLA